MRIAAVMGLCTPEGLCPRLETPTEGLGGSMAKRKTPPRELSTLEEEVADLEKKFSVEYVPWPSGVDWVEFIAELAVKLWLAQQKLEKEEREKAVQSTGDSGTATPKR
jgi:hypothetical protein